MRKPAPLVSLAALLLLGAGPALAGHDRYDDDDRHSRHERHGVEYAKVVSSTPVYRQVRISTPREECHDERVVYRDRSFADGNALFGAIVGGVAGHQFGSGRGNAAATAAGALIGASIAQERAGGVRERVRYEPVCTTYRETRYEDRIEGYDVAYKLHGRVYHTRMSHDPGNRIPVRVAVSPAYDD